MELQNRLLSIKLIHTAQTEINFKLTVRKDDRSALSISLMLAFANAAKSWCQNKIDIDFYKKWSLN